MNLTRHLNSTTRGNQVDEVALSIWATQTYKRYVRARLTESPLGVDRLLFPKYCRCHQQCSFNGRHGEACGMLKDLWAPFGFSGMPRLIIVLAKTSLRSESLGCSSVSLSCINLVFPKGILTFWMTFIDFPFLMESLRPMILIKIVPFLMAE